MIKRLIRTIFFLLLIGGASFINIGEFVPVILTVCGIGIIALLGFAVYHIKFVRKSSLFCTMVAACLLFSISTAFAANPMQEDLDFITGQHDVLCATGAVSDSGYDPDILGKANDVIDKANKISVSGSVSGVAKATLECAQKYVTNASGLDSIMSPTCAPILDLLLKAIDGDESCWPCNIVQVLIDSMQSLAVSAYPAMRSIAVGLGGILFLFWIALRVMIFFGQMGFARIGEFFTHLIQHMLLMLVLIGILYMPVAQLYRMTVSPFIIASADLANSLTAMADRTSGFDKTPVAKITRLLDKIGLAEMDCEYCNKIKTGNAVGNTFLDQGAVNACLCMVCKVYKQVTPFIELGKTLSCFGTQLPKLMNDIPGFSAVSMFSFSNMNWVLLGFLFVVTFSLFMFIIGFHLIGIFLELTFALIFTPIFVMCLAFKATRGYAKKGWELILHAMSVLIAISIAINLSMVLFTEMLPDSMASMFIGLFTGSPSALLSAFSVVDPHATGVGETASGLTAGFSVGNLLSGIPVVGGMLSGMMGGTPGTSLFTVLMLIAFIIMGFSIISASIKMAEALTNTQNIGGHDDISTSLLAGAAAGFAVAKGGFKTAGSVVTGEKARKENKEKKKKEEAGEPASS